MDLVKRLGVVLTVLCGLFQSDIGHAAQPSRQSVEIALDQWQPLLQEAALRFDIPTLWLRAVMRAESAGQAFINGVPTISKAGAMGLMQIMPLTWAELRDRYNLGIDPYNPHDNILAGAAYLRQMLDRYGWPLCVAAYHVGPKRVDDYLAGQGVLPEVTLTYVAKVTGVASLDSKMMVVVNNEGSLFFAVGERHSDKEMQTSSAFERRLFAPITHAVRPIHGRDSGNDPVSREVSHVQMQ